MQKDAITVVSGIQPTGELHLGNWAGGIRNWLDLQHQHPGRCFFFIADYHSMTVEYETAAKRAQALDLAASLLALGIDPDKATIFAQSDAPEVTELCWILNTVTPVAEMERMTQFKDKSARHEKNVNMGLFDYPVLQAADILIYGGNAVPVGTDQVQHVETTRVIARNFNKRFGETFPEPKPLLTDTPKVMSLTEPTKKMSKSHGPKSILALGDEPEETLKKLRGVPTEASGLITPEKLKTEEYAGVALLIDLFGLLGAADEAAEITKDQPVKYGNLKRRAAELFTERFAGYREAKKSLLRDPRRIEAILEEGGRRARAIAIRTMEDVRKKTGLR